MSETTRNVWDTLKHDYHVSRTPKSLVSAITSNLAKGMWHKHGFFIKYTAEKQHNVIVVSTEDVAKYGGCCGATCYINTNNTNQCVWDI